MPFVDRDGGSGNVIGIFNRPQRQSHEFLAPDHPDVVAFENERNTVDTNEAAQRAAYATTLTPTPGGRLSLVELREDVEALKALLAERLGIVVP